MFLPSLVSPQAARLSIHFLLRKISRAAPPWGTWLRTHYGGIEPTTSRALFRRRELYCCATTTALCHEPHVKLSLWWRHLLVYFWPQSLLAGFLIYSSLTGWGWLYFYFGRYENFATWKTSNKNFPRNEEKQKFRRIRATNEFRCAKFWSSTWNLIGTRGKTWIRLAVQNGLQYPKPAPIAPIDLGLQQLVGGSDGSKFSQIFYSQELFSALKLTKNDRSGISAAI